MASSAPQACVRTRLDSSSDWEDYLCEAYWFFHFGSLGPSLYLSERGRAAEERWHSGLGTGAVCFCFMIFHVCSTSRLIRECFGLCDMFVFEIMRKPCLGACLWLLSA